MANLLKDANGDTSSKRVAAFIGIIIMAVISGIAVFKEPSQAANILWPWAVSVTGLLGVTVAERKK